MNPRAEILITDFQFPDVTREREVARAAGCELRTAQCRSAADVIAAGQSAEVLIVQWAPVTAEVLQALPGVRAVVRYGIGYDNVDVDAAAARGVAVCNVPDYCVDEVADHTLALALSLARQLPQTHARTVAGEWKITPPAAVRAFRDTVFACAGFGRIARCVLRRAQAFGFRCAAYDPFVPSEVFAAEGVAPLALDALFSTAHILSLHLPLTRETRHFVNGARLAQMPAGALVINTSRGGLIDTPALANALRNGVVAGAGLDVFEEEPLPATHPLRSAPNIILTSHTAWFSTASVPRLQQLAAEEAVRAVTGLPLRNQVNRGVAGAR